MKPEPSTATVATSTTADGASCPSLRAPGRRQVKAALVVAVALIAAACGGPPLERYQRARPRRVPREASGTTAARQQDKSRSPSMVELPEGTAEQPLSSLVRINPRFMAFDEQRQQRDLREFVRPWAPRPASGAWDAWRAVVETIDYDYAKVNLPPSDFLWQRPAFTWRTRKGVCIDTAMLLCAWLLARGDNAYVAIGAVQPSTAASTFARFAAAGPHAWVVLRDTARKNTYLLETAGDTRLTWKMVSRLLPDAGNYALEAVFNDRSFYAAPAYVSKYAR